MSTEGLLSIMIGIGLSAACGFRVFVPLMIMSLASLSGHLTLASGFQWIGSYPALIAFCLATVLEIGGYYLPWVDHFLDLIATPAAVVAGIIVVASTVTDMSPFLRWSLAIIAGGGIAGTVQVTTSMTRLASAAVSGGIGNPVVSTVEAGGSILLSILSVAAPLVALVAAVVLVILLHGPVRRLIQRMRTRKSADAPTA